MHSSSVLRQHSKAPALVLILAVMFLLPQALFAANVTIPTFQLLTRGILEGGQFSLETAGEVEIAFGGGYKFGGQLALSLAGTNLEAATTPSATYDPDNIDALLDRTLRFKSASVVVRSLFGIPLDVTYFIGESERLLNGDVFPEKFGSDIVATDFRGLLYFPTGVVYDGVHTIDGTGLSLSYLFSQRFLLEGAIYQDAYRAQADDPPRYSTDVRVAFNTLRFKTEAFIGASFPAEAWGIYRGGVLLFYNTGQGGEFLMQVGLPRWAPVTDGAISIDDFYFLFEPRVHISFMSIVLTLFWHPEYYMNQLTNENQATDIIVRLIAGNVQENVVSGGIETGVTLRPQTSETLRVSVAPFASINASGVIWDLKANVKAFPFALDDLLEFYIGIRTEF